MVSQLSQQPNKLTATVRLILQVRKPKLVAVATVQVLSDIRLFVTPMDHCTPGFPVLHYLPEFALTHGVSDTIHHLILCCPLLLLLSKLEIPREHFVQKWAQ